MSDEISKMSSDELKQAIRTAPIPENTDDSPDVGMGVVGDEVVEFGGESDQSDEMGEQDGRQFIESKHRYEFPDEQAKREVAEEREQAAREAEEEKQEATLKYFEGRVKSSGGEGEFLGGLQQALASDFLDLRDKYSCVQPLVDEFGQLYNRGKIKLTEKHLERYDNPHEQLFLEWVGKRAQMEKMTIEEIKTLIETGARGPDLRSKSKEILFPQMMKPEPKPRPKPKRQEKRQYRMPEFSADDLNEAVKDYMAKHPEKFRF